MNEHEDETNCQTCEVVCSAVCLACSTEDYEDEYTGKEYLCQKTAEYWNGAGAVSLKVVGSCSLETC